MLKGVITDIYRVGGRRAIRLSSRQRGLTGKLHSDAKEPAMTQLQTERGTIQVPAGTWKVDPAHSSVAFEVKHMMIATVRGLFSEFDGTLEAEEDPTASRARGWVNVASIDTGNADRDAHLRSPDFFDADRYPRATFESTRIAHVEGGRYRITGDLTLKDVTREVVAEVTVLGAAEDPWGHERVGVEIRSRINRVDFGLTWQQLLASGGMLVGEEIKLLIDISAVKA
jgi:polyisoprenoid-binding protein YceI